MVRAIEWKLGCGGLGDCAWSEGCRNLDACCLWCERYDLLLAMKVWALAVVDVLVQVELCVVTGGICVQVEEVNGAAAAADGVESAGGAAAEGVGRGIHDGGVRDLCRRSEDYCA